MPGSGCGITGSVVVPPQSPVTPQFVGSGSGSVMQFGGAHSLVVGIDVDVTTVVEVTTVVAGVGDT
jgi:hypothetical protein